MTNDEKIAAIEASLAKHGYSILDAIKLAADVSRILESKQPMNWYPTYDDTIVWLNAEQKAGGKIPIYAEAPTKTSMRDYEV